jgi:multiple sugar transport system ATP-binding protein
MEAGVIQQIGKPQEVYDDPKNLFVAKFLGTPPINVFHGEVKDGAVLIDGAEILKVNGIENQEVWAAIRPEGFVLDENGPFTCTLSGLEVMGRDVSVVSTNEKSANPVIRSIISAENKVDLASPTVRFTLKPKKVFIFRKSTEERIRFDIG